MPERNYWLDLFTGKTWQEFINAGAYTTGFRDNRWRIVSKIKKGDYFICYLTGVSRFIGITEVTSDPYEDNTILWSEEIFPSRLHVNVIVALSPETALPIIDFRKDLSIFENLISEDAWSGHVRGSPVKWSAEDGEIILRRLLEAKANPVLRPVDPKKLERRPQTLRTKIGHVTVPEKDDNVALLPKEDLPIEIKKHTEIQHLLLKLGSEMRFNVWVARNDRGREINGRKFSEIFKLLDDLPLQFDEATTKTIAHIDVLWLNRNSITAAFEIESTTSIYSGLLRMSDLIAMQPNLNIPLYMVAPDDRRQKVLEEVNRPTFMRLSPPLVKVCRFISFSKLQEQYEKILPFIRLIRPEFIETVSESCNLEDV